MSSLFSPAGAVLHFFIVFVSLLGLWLGVCTGFILESIFFLGLFHKMSWKKLADKVMFWSSRLYINMYIISYLDYIYHNV